MLNIGDNVKFTKNSIYKDPNLSEGGTGVIVGLPRPDIDYYDVKVDGGITDDPNDTVWPYLHRELEKVE